MKFRDVLDPSPPYPAGEGPIGGRDWHLADEVPGDISFKTIQ